MQRLSLIVLLGASVGLAACSMDNPAEVRDSGQDFPVAATWNATAEPADTVSTESGVLALGAAQTSARTPRILVPAGKVSLGPGVTSRSI